jgi:4-hydroxy-tetrahydrodipicolinate reductase
MKISIIGNGKMGKEIVKIAQERNHQIINVFDIENKNEMTSENLKKSDVVIEFTRPEAAYENIISCLSANVPCVSGTTGWLDKLDEIKGLCKTENKTFFYASNFSIGVNIFFKINQFLSKLMNNSPNYDVDITEIHHIHKLDAPSGTAIQLANQIIENLDRKKTWTLDQKQNLELKIKAVREGEIPGVHIIKYDSETDFIEITHSLKNRKSLALGAILAAEFVFDKKGFYTMDNLLQF